MIRSPLPRLLLLAVLSGALLAPAAETGFARTSVPSPESPDHRSPNEGSHIEKKPRPTAEEKIRKPRAEKKKKPPQQKTKPRQRKIACSSDSMPAAERRRMLREGERIRDTQGLAAALRFARQSGANYRKRLEARGVCPKR